MAELFDVVAGTESGGFIAANLVSKGPGKSGDAAGSHTIDSGNYMSAALNTQWYKDHINNFYFRYHFPMTAIFFCSLLLAIVVSLIAYRATD